MKIVTFIRKNGETAKRFVDFPRERDTFRNKIIEIVEDFACESKFLHFSFFFHHFSTFFHFFMIFHFFLFLRFLFFHFFNFFIFSFLFIFI